MGAAAVFYEIVLLSQALKLKTQSASKLVFNLYDDNHEMLDFLEAAVVFSPRLLGSLMRSRNVLLATYKKIDQAFRCDPNMLPLGKNVFLKFSFSSSFLADLFVESTRLLFFSYRLLFFFFVFVCYDFSRSAFKG